MSYEAINQQLGVYSCSIADLTMDQVSSFLGQWNDGSSIGSLTAFYDNSGNIVINKDRKNYEKLRDFVTAYMEATEEGKNKVIEAFKVNGANSVITVIDNALLYRSWLAEKKAEDDLWKSTKKMLGKQYIPGEKELDLIDKIYSEARDMFSARVDIYNYAFIQGKKAERSRKKTKR
jgi:hypothetical protein